MGLAIIGLAVIGFLGTTQGWWTFGEFSPWVPIILIGWVAVLGKNFADAGIKKLELLGVKIDFKDEQIKKIDNEIREIRQVVNVIQSNVASRSSSNSNVNVKFNVSGSQNSTGDDSQEKSSNPSSMFGNIGSDNNRIYPYSQIFSGVNAMTVDNRNAVIPTKSEQNGIASSRRIYRPLDFSDAVED